MTRIPVHATSGTTLRALLGVGCLVAAAQGFGAAGIRPLFPSLRNCLPALSRQLRPPTRGLTMAAESHQAGYLPTLVDSSITYEDIATFPRPGCSAPDSIGFSPDDTVVIYLASSDGSLTRQLYAMDITSGSVQELCKPPSGTGEEATFSLEEKLRRERARQLHTGTSSPKDTEHCPSLRPPTVSEGAVRALRRPHSTTCGVPSSERTASHLYCRLLCFVCMRLTSHLRPIFIGEDT